MKRGDWVQIKRRILAPEERPENLPDDTRKVPLELKTKGFLMNDSKLGDWVKVKTVTGRIVEGKLLELNPPYTHDFGRPPRELLSVGLELRKRLRDTGGDINE